MPIRYVGDVVGLDHYLSLFNCTSSAISYIFRPREKTIFARRSISPERNGPISFTDGTLDTPGD